MTITDLKDRKREAERKITEAVQQAIGDFHEDTDVPIERVQIESLDLTDGSIQVTGSRIRINVSHAPR